MTCPHRNVIHCPLYHAAHSPAEAGGHECDDGRCNENGMCAVSRGLDYARAVAKLTNQRLVAELAFAEHAAEDREQVRRNWMH